MAAIVPNVETSAGERRYRVAFALIEAVRIVPGKRRSATESDDSGGVDASIES